MVRKRIKLGAIIIVLFSVFIGNCFASGGLKTPSLSQALSRVDLFSELTQAQRESLKAAATLRVGKSGEQIIQQGKARDKMFILL